MEIDRTSLTDLSIFHPEEEQSIFHHLNLTRTLDGKSQMMRLFREPFKDAASIRQTQEILKLLLKKEAHWPESISNGTIMVMERFYETQMGQVPQAHNFFQSAIYRFTNSHEYSLVRYSIGHFADFVKGFQQLINLFLEEVAPQKLKRLLERAQLILERETVSELASLPEKHILKPAEVVYFGHFLQSRFKNACNELIELYAQLDAWYGMAMAVKKFGLQFPEIVEDKKPCIEAVQLYHILLPKPIAYDLQLDKAHNFLFLTGANMAGKSTFIRAVGAAVYLAHLGMGVPAQSFRCSLFDGIISNITVADNIFKGESYFYNEVQRIKNTILKINNGKNWLVLIDELFKGTNVQDAMKCSLSVINGLIKINQSLFILSTHLYEIGESLKPHTNIRFRYFETLVKEDQLEFNYHLREGISNDRLGYLILKREKVVDLLERL